MSSDRTVARDRDALAGKRLLVILGSYRSKRHIYERTRDLGVHLVVIDGPDHWLEAEAGPGGLIERYLSVDLAPLGTFAARATDEARRSGLPFDGIGTIDGFAGGFAARIAGLLNLPFHSIEAADRARDKHRTRQACESMAIPGPRYARVGSADDLENAAAHVGFPAVLKPVSGVGSVQAGLVRDARGLADGYQRIVAEVEQSRVSARLNSDRDWFRLMWPGVPHLVLESWIEGRKYDVDLLVEGGAVVYAHATDDLEPCGLRDVRRVAPAGLEPEREALLIEHAASCVRAIGFQSGAFNVEVKDTKAGPCMIEVNGRLGGYSTVDVHRAVWGVDLIEQWLRFALNLPPNVHERAATCWVAESLLPSPRTGTLARDGFLESLQKEPRLVVARQWVFAGDRVSGVETGAPDWLGAVVVKGQSRENALSELDRILASLDLPVVPA